jgi:CHAT domain-containing protein
MRRTFILCVVLCSLSLSASAQSAPEPTTLVPTRPVERELAGGESHVYQISLAAGQFVRFRLEQRGVDAALLLAAPDGKQLVEVDLTGAGQEEPLSLEAAATGTYRLTVRGVEEETRRGAYRLEAAVQPTATAQDRKRLAAEALLVEVSELSKQRAEKAEHVIEKAQQALPLWRELGEPRWTAHTLYMLGAAYDDLRRMEKASEFYEQALAAYRELKYQPGVASALFQLGFQHIRINRHEKAIEYLGQALAIYRELKDRQGEATTLYRLGYAHSWLSRYEKAIQYQEQALAIQRELRDRRGEADTLNGLGGFYNTLGRYEKGIEYVQQALAISRELKYPFGVGSALGRLGTANSRLGRYDKAIEYIEQWLASAREAKDRSLETTALNVLGNQYLLTGRYEKAIEFYGQALGAAREGKWRRQEGLVLNNLAVAYANLERHAKAIEVHEQALGIARELKNRINEGNVLAGLGTSYRALGRLEEAVRSHQQAAFIAREVKARDKEADALDGLMLDWKARNRPRLAIYYGKQAVNVLQEIRSDNQGLDRESQQSFIKSNEGTYRTLADLLIAEGRLPEAEQVIRMLKEEEYFEFVRGDEGNSPKAAQAQLTPEEQALEKRYREIADQIATLGTERGTLIDKKSRTAEEEQRLAKIDADLVVAGEAFQKFLDGLTAELGGGAENNARAYQLRESQGLMEDLRELGKGTVALYTLVGEDKYRVILTTPDFQKGYEYPIKAADLNRKVLELREVLQNPRYDPLPLTQELYRIMLGPVAKDLEKAKARTLMWSLDGVLRYVPVSALHDGKKYLAERFDSVVFTPASQARLKDTPARNWDALGLGVSKAHGERIPALPGVVDEMRGIIRDASAANPAAPGKPAGVLPGVLKLDEQFTQETMLAELRKRHKVVHVASHFQFSPGNETNSALLLGDGTFLSLAQIKSLPNVFGGVELLTLSACNTATGGGANGKEVEGFGVLAQRQGAKAVVASLWPVADRSTKLLMQEFYRVREERAGLTKVAALRAAQLKLLRGEVAFEAAESAGRHIIHEEAKPGEAGRQPFKPDPKAPFAHPYYWAPFILIGNWK